MFIIYIARDIIEARTRSLIKKRDDAIRNKDYDKAWVLNMAIDKNVSRVTSLSC